MPVDDAGPILCELAQLEAIQVALAAIASRGDDRRRWDLIDLRRKLAAQIAAIGALAGPFFADAASEDLARLYRAKWSRMRSAAAMHQANWPAVRLGESIEEFQASARTVREANADFVGWVRSAIADIERERSS